MSPATKLGLGALCALLAAILTIALWPASEADKARGDGEQLGTAVSSLYAADSTDGVDAGFVVRELRLVRPRRPHGGGNAQQQPCKEHCGEPEPDDREVIAQEERHRPARLPGAQRPLPTTLRP